MDFIFRRKSRQIIQSEVLEQLTMCNNENVELCSFLEAKIPVSNCVTPKVKKRPLSMWKLWRKYWCTVVRSGPAIEITLDSGITLGADYTMSNEKRSCVTIPVNAVVCRVESKSKKFAFAIFPFKERKPLLYLCANSEIETQKWMADLRQLLRPRKQPVLEGSHFVSIIDNAHSRAAGMTGMYGDLVTSSMGVFIKDVHSGNIITELDWSEIHEFHLATIGRIDDVKQICVMNTTKRFRAGIGQLHFFCKDAQTLVHDLVLEGRAPRRKQSTWSSERPLSLSEGDLRQAVLKASKSQNCVLTKDKLVNRLIGSSEKLSKKSFSGSHNLLDKISLFKCRGVLHPRAVDNDYQPEPESTTDEIKQKRSPRRISNISVASGIYEEIDERTIESFDSNDSVLMNMNLYEDPEDIFLRSKFNMPPPPLPPRVRFGSTSTRYESTSDDGLDSEGCTRSDTPNTTSDETTPSFEEKSNIGRAVEDESEYVAMSPQYADMDMFQMSEPQGKQFQEQELYVVMR